MKTVQLPPEDLSRQRDYTENVRRLFARRQAHPLAFVHTYGCQQNVADGQKLRGMLREMGFSFTEDPKEADLVILNTCAVREHAEQRVFGNLGALTHTKRENPEQLYRFNNDPAAFSVPGAEPWEKLTAEEARAR